jgi:hypothetical protein
LQSFHAAAARRRQQTQFNCYFNHFNALPQQFATIPSKNAWLAFIVLQHSRVYIALQQRVPQFVWGALKEQPMTRLSQFSRTRSTQSPSEQTEDIVTEIFQAATIASVAVLGLLTFAVSL